jgi:hypothetical protein
MGLRSRILAVIRPLPEGGGPATKATLRGLCRNDKQRRKFMTVFTNLLFRGEIAITGGRKTARYGLPVKRQKRRRAGGGVREARRESPPH